ncbi:MAG: hypothetical protein P8X91_09070 [Candidatus Bathyarchaeota archaeon]|jgi:hypothetical protein
MKSSTTRSRIFVFVTQGVGVIFCGIFLIVYFGGLPSTKTLNSDPSFIFLQSVIGVILVCLVFLAILIAFIVIRKNKV